MARVLQIFPVRSMVAAFACLLLAACSEITQHETHGYLETKPLQEQITVGTTTREEVYRLLGSPSTVSAFPPETWYYISSKRETVAFLAPELVGQKVSKIEFDEAGKVSKLDLFDEADARQIDYVERKTPTEGRSLGVMEQLLGNLGRFNTPRDATQSRQ